MDKNTILDILCRFKQALETANGIRVNKLILYGSQAAGTAREDSDIDVVVISDDFADKSYWQRINIISDAICAVFEPIEALAMTRQEWESGVSLSNQPVSGPSIGLADYTTADDAGSFMKFRLHYQANMKTVPLIMYEKSTTRFIRSTFCITV
ncbi:MAG: hypothetical protein B6244_00400 [Candidatus Cloacimonetes bacterium 4572_55]|nr:MAG: hypothetical protein B6244_00400 [Candidatus Cloacimonetes bacterium 4572_55]